MNRTLYFDEAGYTGSDLTNSDQPYFILGSVCFRGDELEQLKSDINFNNYGDELHFKKCIPIPMVVIF